MISERCGTGSAKCRVEAGDRWQTIFVIFRPVQSALPLELYQLSMNECGRGKELAYLRDGHWWGGYLDFHFDGHDFYYRLGSGDDGRLDVSVDFDPLLAL